MVASDRTNIASPWFPYQWNQPLSNMLPCNHVDVHVCRWVLTSSHSSILRALTATCSCPTAAVSTSTAPDSFDTDKVVDTLFIQSLKCTCLAPQWLASPRFYWLKPSIVMMPIQNNTSVYFMLLLLHGTHQLCRWGCTRNMQRHQAGSQIQNSIVSSHRAQQQNLGEK